MQEKLGTNLWLAPSSAMIYISLAELAIEHNQLEDAVHYLEQARPVVEQSGNIVILTSAFSALAQLKKARGRHRRALDLLDQMLTRFSGAAQAILKPLLSQKILVLIAAGNLDEAGRLAMSFSVETCQELDYLREFEGLAMLRLYRQRGQLTPGL